MWDRFVEVFAVYGVIAVLIVGGSFNYFRDNPLAERNEFVFMQLLVWGAMTFVPGAIYILLS